MESIPLLYAEEKFVGRKQQTDKVMLAIKKLIEDTPIEKRTIVFMGERGIGKSWLLQHLSFRIKEEYKNVILFKFDLKKYEKSDHILAVLEILKEFRGSFDGLNRESVGGTPAEASRQTLEDIREQIKKRILIVLVDHVYEADWKLLAGLEDYFLGPLAIEPNTLIILSGRGREYPWKTPELRLKAEFEHLEPLDEKDTEEQLQKQISGDAVKRAKNIYTTTGGNPLGNYLLGKETDPKDGLNAIINANLETIPDSARRQRVREYLEALCVLRAFDEERIPIMLAAYSPEDKRYANWKYADSRQVRDELVQGSFARWDENKGGFVIDDVLRKSLESYVRRVKPEAWVRLQAKALTLYDDWSKKYSKAKGLWTQEMNYHSAALQSHQMHS